MVRNHTRASGTAKTSDPGLPLSILITTIETNEEVQKSISVDEFARLARDEC
ncbi:hypothetical protein [Plantactinospora sp. BB1]|uniref:hypothetical protein n=1 Tax=Plantactinospora sp. BB1 TaxID=2071627 RepID=UPI00131F2037|nr:hypothetical protein [Plantactinospora sp. BB1]